MRNEKEIQIENETPEDAEGGGGKAGDLHWIYRATRRDSVKKLDFKEARLLHVAGTGDARMRGTTRHTVGRVIRGQVMAVSAASVDCYVKE